MKDLFGNELKEAYFNTDRTHRYALVRRWDETKPMVGFIGLNPSKADEEEDDNTITKVKKIASHNGYGGIVMLNLYSVVSSDPDYLLRCSSPCDEYTDEYLLTMADRCHAMVACWGNFSQAIGRDERVTKMIFRLELGFRFGYLKLNKNGSPKHPLYCKDKTEIQFK